jgi:hypothetical protein
MDARQTTRKDTKRKTRLCVRRTVVDIIAYFLGKSYNINKKNNVILVKTVIFCIAFGGRTWYNIELR